MDLREQKFGIELEMTGITRLEAAKAIGNGFGEPYNYAGGYYDSYEVNLTDMGKWKVMSDASIHSQRKEQGRVRPADTSYKVEVVSPICTYEDIPKIQELIRCLRRAGAFTNASCGIHIHINGAPFSPEKIRNLVNIVAAKEDIVYPCMWTAHMNS